MLARTHWTVRRPIAAVIAVVALVLALAVVMADPWNKEKPMPIQGNVASAITTEDLIAVAHTRVFFGHQSVGMNMLNAIPAIYTDHGVSAPSIEQGRAAPAPNGGFIAHQFIGENTKPLLKIEDFNRTMRDGMGRQVDVALMKFLLARHHIQHGCRRDIRQVPRHHGRAGARLPRRHLHPRDGAPEHRAELTLEAEDTGEETSRAERPVPARR